jgi:hypothetical protein
MHALGITHAKMSGMQYCNTSFVRVVSASLLGALIALCLNGAVPAAGTCIEGPALKAGQGGHWYYHVDPVDHRKCWYVTATELKTQQGPLLGPTPSPTSTPNSTLSSWFTSLGAGPPASAVVQPRTTPESRVPPTAPESCSRGSEGAFAPHPALRNKSRSHRATKSTISVSLVIRACGAGQRAATRSGRAGRFVPRISAMEGTAEEREVSVLCTRLALFAVWGLEFDGTRLGSGGHKRAGFYEAADGVRGGITNAKIHA